MAAAGTIDPFAVLPTDFPEELPRRRSRASDLLYIGVSMRRTAPTSARAFQQILSAGGRIRVVLVDPTNEALLNEALLRLGGSPNIDSLRTAITTSLATLTTLDPGASGSLEVRVSSSVPAIGISAIDTGSREALLVAQHYEYRAPSEASPIFRLTVNDGYWYRHFLDEAERMWTDAVPWPIPDDVRVTRLPHPPFLEDFGSALSSSIDDAGELLITGVARNTLLTSQYSRFEKKLLEGATIRFLLIAPDSEAVRVAADRYYAERSPDVLRGRINHSLRLLAELHKSTKGKLQVRLTAYPLGAGVIAAKPLAAGSQPPALLVEYFTYQARGEPKFVLTAADGWVFDNFLGEAEALWRAASELDLTTQTPLPK